jgi:hypothetical protein
LIKGFLKNGRMGEREIHMNDSSYIEKIETLEDEESVDVWKDVLLPSSISKEHTKIRELDIQGLIINILSEPESERPSFINIINPDEKYEKKLKVNFWKEKKIEIEKLEKGQKVLLEGISIKEGFQSLLEANFNRSSNLTILGKVNDLSKYNINPDSGYSPGNQNYVPINKNLGSIQLGETFNLTVRIAWKGRLSSFKRKDDSEGYVIRVGIFDGTGSNLIVLWDDHAKKIDKYSVNDLISVKNAYLRENRGNIEISLARNGLVDLVQEKFAPEIPNTIPPIPINEISKNWKMVTLWGEIVTTNEIRTFKRNDGSEGSVKSIEIIDNTGEIKIVGWNANISLLENLEIGKIISAENLNVRINNYNDFESHLSENSKITIQNDKSRYPDWVKTINYQKKQFSSAQVKKYRRISIDFLTEEYKQQIINESENGTNYSNIDNYFEFKANIVDVFDKPLYYESCSECFKKIEKLSDDSGKCVTHDLITPIPRILFRVIFDDGQDNFSSTLIGTAAEKITGFNPANLKKYLQNNEYNLELLKNEIKNLVFGKEFLVKGRLEVRKSFSQEGEYDWDLKINYIAEANAEAELKELELTN